MELDQEKQNQEAVERCRALAQRIVRELAPRSVQVLENSGLLEETFAVTTLTLCWRRESRNGLLGDFIAGARELLGR